jgi:hypothetical protein
MDIANAGGEETAGRQPPRANQQLMQCRGGRAGRRGRAHQKARIVGPETSSRVCRAGRSGRKVPQLPGRTDRQGKVPEVGGRDHRRDAVCATKTRPTRPCSRNSAPLTTTTTTTMDCRPDGEWIGGQASLTPLRRQVPSARLCHLPVALGDARIQKRQGWGQPQRLRLRRVGTRCEAASEPQQVRPGRTRSGTAGVARLGEGYARQSIWLAGWRPWPAWWHRAGSNEVGLSVCKLRCCIRRKGQNRLKRLTINPKGSAFDTPTPSSCACRGRGVC